MKTQHKYSLRGLRIHGSLALLAFGLLTGCATSPQKMDSLAERAQARWDAVVAGDYQTAYTYYSPGYRSATPLTDYTVSMSLKRVRWTAATYRDQQCEDKVCTLRFDIDYQVKRPVPGVDKYDGKSVAEDTWVEAGGEWWYVPKK